MEHAADDFKFIAQRLREIAEEERQAREKKASEDNANTAAG